MNILSNRLGEGVAAAGFLVHLEANLTVFYLILGYLEGTLRHVVDVVLTVAVAHYLALTAYIERLGHACLAYIIAVMD